MTPNKDIVNIENNIRNIGKELAKQGNKISKQMKSLEKADRSAKEFPGIVDGLAHNGSLRFSVGKNGKAQKPSEPTKRTQGAKKK